MKTRTTKHENPITSSSPLDLVSEFHRTTRKKKNEEKKRKLPFHNHIHQNGHRFFPSYSSQQ